MSELKTRPTIASVNRFLGRQSVERRVGCMHRGTGPQNDAHSVSFAYDARCSAHG